MVGLFKSNPRRKLRKFVKEKKFDEALKYGHEIEKSLEHDPDISFIIGTIYFILGNPEKTIFYMNKTLEIGQYDIDALSIKASVFLNLKNKSGARKCCEKIRDIDPKNKALKEIETELNQN